MSKFYSTLGTDNNLVYIVMGCILVAFLVEALHYGMKFYDKIRYGNDE